MKKTILYFLMFYANSILANNITISNVTLVGQDKVLDYTFVQFDISWDNSWRTSTLESNWDAAWIFIKFRKQSQTTWNHATLNTSGHTQPANSTITTPSDGKGVFIYRSSNLAQSNVNYTGVQLRWNYGVDGIADNDNVEVCVFAIEMVYIPTGNFYIGDGDGTNESTNAFHSGTSNSAVQITTSLVNNVRVDVNGWDDNQIENPGIGIDGDGGLDTDNNGSIDNPNFPTGYTPFYIMKYEISQKQYVDFLNTLTRTQQNTRTETDVSTDAITNIFVMSNTSSISYRNNIVCPSSGNGTSNPITFSTSTSYIACSYLSWQDVAAYSDWAGLRPMTDLEYEKAGRGTSAPVYQEYAWGNTTLTQATGISNVGLTNEVASNSTANIANGNHASVQGPMRTGWPAGGSRQASGASYYGVMELSGNVSERVVTIGTAAGRSYTGVHGDGILDANGDMNTVNWPNIATADGSGIRGGDWINVSANNRLSDRNDGAKPATNRLQHRGFHAARTAP